MSFINTCTILTNCRLILFTWTQSLHHCYLCCQRNMQFISVFIELFHGSVSKQCVWMLHLNYDGRVEFWPARLLSAGSYRSAASPAPCVFSVLEQIKCCMLPCQQILRTLMCRWTQAKAHTGSYNWHVLGSLGIQMCKCTCTQLGFALLYYIKTVSHTLSQAAYHTQIIQ